MKKSTFIKGVQRMSKKDDSKPAEVKEAEAHGGQTYNPNAETAQQPLDPSKCPDCKGEGISDPLGLRVCATCEGSGKA
jgi:DnaJ-class molecular chaperone